jgi:ribosomal protein L12E/L44/L45/RPP1/RPP2
MDQEWKHFERHVVAPMGGSGGQSVFMMQILGSPQASEYFAAYTGQALPSNILVELASLATALKRHSVMASPTLRFTHYVSIGDFIAHHTQGREDELAYRMLRNSASSRPVSMPAQQAFAGTPVVVYSALVQHKSLARLQRFFDVAIAPGLSDEAKATQWTWADVLMIVLILSTSVHWEYRLDRLVKSKHVQFPALTPSTIANLSAFMVRALVQRQHENVGKARDLVLVEVDANLTHVALTALYTASSVLPATAATAPASPAVREQERTKQEEEQEQEEEEEEEGELFSEARRGSSGRGGRKVTDLSQVPAYKQGKGGVYREKGKY